MIGFGEVRRANRRQRGKLAVARGDSIMDKRAVSAAKKSK